MKKTSLKFDFCAKARHEIVQKCIKLHECYNSIANRDLFAISVVNNSGLKCLVSVATKSSSTTYHFQEI